MNSSRILTDNDQRPVAEFAASRRHWPTAVAEPEGRRLAILSVAALGVAYGDIGTSPLDAFRVALRYMCWILSRAASPCFTDGHLGAEASVRAGHRRVAS